MKTDSLYGIKVVLQKDLTNVECWNCTDGSTGTIPAGNTIEVCHVNDATHTTIQVESGPALTCVDRYIEPPQPPACSRKPGLMGLKLNLKPDGSEPQNVYGYRFIVPNKMLREATGLPYPEKTRDLVGEIMAAESGELDDNQMRETIKALKADGSFKGLQGWWGREAARLGV